MFMFLNDDAFSPALGSSLPASAIEPALESSTVTADPSAQRSNPMSLHCLLNTPVDVASGQVSAAVPGSEAVAGARTRPFGRGSLSEKRGIVLPSPLSTAVNAVLRSDDSMSISTALQDKGECGGIHSDRKPEVDVGGMEVNTSIESMEENVVEDVTMGVHGLSGETLDEDEPAILPYPDSSSQHLNSGASQYKYTTPFIARQQTPTTFDCPPVSTLHLENVKHVTQRNFDLDIDYSAQGNSSDAGTSPGRDSDTRATEMEMDASRWGALTFDSLSSDSVPYSFEGQAQLQDEMSFGPGADYDVLGASGSWSQHHGCGWSDSLGMETRERFPLMLGRCDETTPKIDNGNNGHWFDEADLAGTASSSGSGSDGFMASMEDGVVGLGNKGCEGAYDHIGSAWNGLEDLDGLGSLNGCADGNGQADAQ